MTVHDQSQFGLLADSAFAFSHSLTLRFHIDVRFIPTVGLATDVNKNLFISISETHKMFNQTFDLISQNTFKPLL